jgi:hypothetical protein
VVLRTMQRHQDPDLPSYAQTIAQKEMEHDDYDDDAGLPQYNEVVRGNATSDHADATTSSTARVSSSSSSAAAAAAATVSDDDNNDDADDIGDDVPLIARS